MNQHKIGKIFSKIPQIETERLLLRKLVPSDARDMYEYARQDRVTEFLLWEPHPDEWYTARYVNYVQTQYRAGTFFDWAVEWKQNGRMIGTCGFTSFDLPNGRGEVGYVLNPEYWGKGIAAEAVMAVFEFGFLRLGLNRIETKYIFGNDQSRRVMEKCGMTFEGILRSYMLIKGEYRDIGFCSILRSEFDSLRARRGLPFGLIGK